MYFFRDRFVFPNFVSKKCFSTEFVFLTKIVILHNRGSSMAPKTKKLGIKHNQAVVGGEGGEKKLHSFSQFLSTHPPPTQKKKKTPLFRGYTSKFKNPKVQKSGWEKNKNNKKKTIPPHTSYGLHWLGIHSDLTPTHLRRLPAVSPPTIKPPTPGFSKLGKK